MTDSANTDLGGDSADQVTAEDILDAAGHVPTADEDVLAGIKAADSAELIAKSVELGSVAKAKAELVHRAKAAAVQRVLLESTPPLVTLTAGQFLDGEDLKFLIPGLFYPDSLSKVYGPPGCTKSFLLLDVLLHMATGTRWFGHTLPRYRVHYVMAEGFAVNRMRTKSWLEHHSIDPDELEGWFTAVPEAVMLTPEGVREYREFVATDRPAVIALDTKNAMMVGEENSASDVAVMIRSMHELRKASGACVVLVDHTGLSDDTRGRGSNAVIAAMDTEIRVRRDEKSGIATATVTRDKAGETGHAVSYELKRVRGSWHPAVEPIKGPVDAAAGTESSDWDNVEFWPLPDDVVNLKPSRGRGRAAVEPVALYMRAVAETIERGIGRTRAEAVRDVVAAGRAARRTAEMAWEALVVAGRLEAADGVRTPTGRHQWVPRSDDPARLRSVS